MLNRLVMIVIVVAGWWLFSASPASAAADVTEARYMTQKQFLRSLKQVSLTMHGRGDPLNEYLFADQARDIILNAMANRGIAVRPNSPVVLEVTLSHERRSTTGSDEPIVFHDYFLTLQFFVRGAVLRKGTFHVLPVAPASAWWVSYVLVPNELQRVLLNAETGKRLRQQFAQGVVDSLNSIERNEAVDATPYPPKFWSEKEKIQGNASFARVMRADAPMDTSLILDLDIEPKLDITAQFKEPACHKIGVREQFREKSSRHLGSHEQNNTLAGNF